MTSSWDDEDQHVEGQERTDRRHVLFRWAVLVVVLILGVVWLRGGEQPSERTGAATGEAWYRCTMPVCNDPGSPDPESRCPVCGMTRELVTSAGSLPSHDQPPAALNELIRLGPRARHLAEVAVEPAERQFLTRKIRSMGQLAVDERRQARLESRLSGVVERVAADYTGMTVRRGDHLVEIYSGELLDAQNQLLSLLWGYGRFPGSGRNRSEDQDLMTVRHELQILGMTSQEIDEMIEKEHEDPYSIVKAPFDGTILQKGVVAGMFVKTGDLLYELADLSRLWILVDVFEDDLPWIRLGQEISVETRSLPGEQIRGEVTFVDPVLNTANRTFRVRAEISNPGLRLKPGTYVTAEVEAPVGRDGDLGDGTEDDRPLAVPRDAVLDTGTRAIVYVEREKGAYEGREVRLGGLAWDAAGRQLYPVLAGLEQGEAVVTRGAFAIDSQRQIVIPGAAVSPGPGNEVRAAEEHGGGESADHSHSHPEPLPAAPKKVLRFASRDQEVKTSQTHCPVLGDPIDPSAYIDYRGVRIFFCSHLCAAKFLAHPEEAIPNLPEDLRQRVLQWPVASASEQHD